MNDHVFWVQYASVLACLLPLGWVLVRTGASKGRVNRVDWRARRQAQADRMRPVVRGLVVTGAVRG